ncbi:Alpha/Beta hydrolase protein [Melanogaster broomeanus]|nr:Alpha/Beta hydrolase protein [Melanogaster broomeanus]
MSSPPSNIQWGSPRASKRALLIHGLISSSHTWESVGLALARAGYHVTAPNLVGHGCRKGSDFRISALADDLRCYFTDSPAYDCVIGHSMGGLAALYLLPYMSRVKPTSVILIDPGVQVLGKMWTKTKALLTSELAEQKNAESYMAENPRWSERDAFLRALAIRMCQDTLSEGISKGNETWSFSHLFDAIPSHVQVTVLVCDPSLKGVCRPEHIPAHPQVRIVPLKDVGHYVQYEKPEMIVAAALSSVKKTAKL